MRVFGIGGGDRTSDFRSAYEQGVVLQQSSTDLVCCTCRQKVTYRQRRRRNVAPLQFRRGKRDLSTGGGVSDGNVKNSNEGTRQEGGETRYRATKFSLKV